MQTCIQLESSTGESERALTENSVGHIADFRSYDLPADVFAEGEIRPTRIKKTKNPTKPSAAPKSAQSTNPKRSFSDTGLDVGDHSMIKD